MRERGRADEPLSQQETRWQRAKVHNLFNAAKSDFAFLKYNGFSGASLREVALQPVKGFVEGINPFDKKDGISAGEALLQDSILLASAIDVGIVGYKSLMGPFCFVAGTPVATPDGGKAIEQVKANDPVWAYDAEGLDLNDHFILHNQEGTVITVPFTAVDIARPTDGSVRLPLGTDLVGALDDHLVLQHGQPLNTVAPGTFVCFQGKVYIVLAGPWPGTLALVDTGTVLRHIVRTFVNFTHQLTDLTVRGADGQSTTITGTPGHKFYVPVMDAYVSMSELPVGTIVQTTEGFATVTANSTRQTESLIYNFEVEGVHNYYVGDVQVLVHNENCTVAKIVARLKQTGKYGNKQCLEFAKALRKRLKAKGINGEIVEINSASGFPMVLKSNGYQNISDTGLHVGVQIGEEVIDNLHDNFLPFDEWMDDFDAVGGVHETNRKGF